MMKTLRWIVFAIAAIAMNFPVIVTLITSFKSAREISSNAGLWINSPTLTNYISVLTDTTRFNIWLYLFNSTVAALIGTLLAMILTFGSVIGAQYGSRLAARLPADALRIMLGAMILVLAVAMIAQLLLPPVDIYVLEGHV